MKGRGTGSISEGDAHSGDGCGIGYICLRNLNEQYYKLQNLNKIKKMNVAFILSSQSNSLL